MASSATAATGTSDRNFWNEFIGIRTLLGRRPTARWGLASYFGQRGESSTPASNPSCAMTSGTSAVDGLLQLRSRAELRGGLRGDLNRLSRLRVAAFPSGPGSG